jgi:hypothetical protein
VMTHGGCCKAKAQWIPFLSSRLTTKIIQNLQKIRLSLICSWFCHMSFGPGLSHFVKLDPVRCVAECWQDSDRSESCLSPAGAQETRNDAKLYNKKNGIQVI